MTTGIRQTGRCAGAYLAFFMAILPFFAGCAMGTPSGGLPQREVIESLSLQRPTIQWVAAIHQPEDAGIGKGFWKRVSDFVFGPEEEGIGKPYGVYADRHGRLFVVDVANAVIHIFGLKEHEYILIGEGETRLFRTPIAITGDGDDTVFITDSAAGTVFRYTLKDRKLTPFIAGKLNRPTGIALNARNRLLYVTDTTSHQVVVFDMTGAERFRIGGRGEEAGAFNFPTDVFIDAGGDLYVTDALNSRVQIFSADGRFIRMFGASGDTAGYLAKPKGVAVDSEGNVYVCDSLQDSVQIFNRGGELLFTFGSSGTGPAEFSMPSGIFIDAMDTVYVADGYNRRVQVFYFLGSKGAGSPPPSTDRRR